MIEIRDVTKVYDTGGAAVTAVDRVSFTLEQGEVASVIGHAGSGKTTLLGMIGGLTRPDEGRVLVDSTDVWAISDDARSDFRNRGIGFIYQFASLIPTLTALENVLLPGAFGEQSHAGIHRAKELLERVGLAGKMDAYPFQLSGGQQRLVAIARAFVSLPGLVLADEPTGDLDEAAERQVLDFFLSMNRENRTTFLLVTHSSEIAFRSGRRFRMTHGRIEEL